MSTSTATEPADQPPVLFREMPGRNGRRIGVATLNRPRTLNGLILEMLETIPEPGTGLRIDDTGIEILQVADNAVKTARMRPLNV